MKVEMIKKRGRIMVKYDSKREEGYGDNRKRRKKRSKRKMMDDGSDSKSREEEEKWRVMMNDRKDK